MFRILALSLLLLGVTPTRAQTEKTPKPYTTPLNQEILSTHFKVTVNGHPIQVLHAANNLYFANFDTKHKTRITVEAPTDGFWDRGVEIQPWRLGIRPKRVGRTLTFTLDGPQKITLSRPADYLSDAEMLYLFGNPPETHPPIAATANVRYYAPGIHPESIDAHTGDTIYLAPGAVLFGALNLWQVHDVHVSGRGVIVYDGPQNPADDDGWMHRPDWHCIVMDQARNISVEGITCVTRSRTWQIQMKDSRDILFDNVKVIGANTGNANADGMDWLGGGGTVIRNSFFRAADDIFALQSSWEGYGPKAFAVQGKPVTDITVENSTLSTSISNIVRVGWPEKNFDGGNFTLRNSDVLHMGPGGCGIPFAFMEYWADPHGRGSSSGFRFQNIRMEDWYSLVQLRQPSAGVPFAGIKDVHFQDVAALELPALVPSVLKGDVQGTALDNVDLAGATAKTPSDVPMDLLAGAATPAFTATGPQVHIVTTPGLLHPHQRIHFEAVSETPPDTSALHYAWTFGDGTHATGHKVTHRFPDTAGTLLDNSGRFRVLLEITDTANRHSWRSVPLVLGTPPQPAPGTTPQPAPGTIQTGTPGLAYRYTETGPDPENTTPTNATASTVAATVKNTTSTVPATVETTASTVTDKPIAVTDNAFTVTAPTPPQPPPTGTTPTVSLAAIPHRPAHYRIDFAGNLSIPADGGYTFTLVSNDSATLTLDGKLLGTTPAPFPQICGLPGNAARPVTVSAVLAHGPHRLNITETHTTGDSNFQLWWQSPTIPLQPIPAAALSHLPDSPTP